MTGPLNYIGGKHRLARRLVEMIPEHVTYVEPFAGGAQVFFAKPPSRVEVLNDLSGDVINFFRVCQHHPEELIRCLRFAPASRALFGMLQRQDDGTLTNVQRAARFLYLQKNSFGGHVIGQHYHYGVSTRVNYNPDTLPRLIDAASKRLARVQLECRPYELILERFDRETTFFYLDPPYVGVRFYKFNLRNEEFERLADRLATVRGKFLLSINDHPVALKAFRRFNLRKVRVAYTASRRMMSVRELVFANYTLAELKMPNQSMKAHRA